MGEPSLPRSSIADRIGLAAERIIEGSTRFTTEPRDLTILPTDGKPPHPTLVGLHGMGMRIEVFARWLLPLADEPWALLLPEGPYPLERRVGKLRGIGHAWYIYDGDSSTFRASIGLSEARLTDLIDRRAEEHRLDRTRMILLGFSQGAYLSGCFGLGNAERFRGIAVVGGRIRTHLVRRDLATIPRLPILFVHGREDERVPLALVRESVEELERLGFPVTFIETQGGHEWDGATTDAVRSWARERLH